MNQEPGIIVAFFSVSLLFTSFYSPVFVLLMTMGLALRRSRRATPRKTSEYSVGDVVEVSVRIETMGERAVDSMSR